MNLTDLQRMKQQGAPIRMITCYDYWTAKILAQTAIDCVLVGDSAAQVMHGHSTTLPADVEMMELHIHAVKRGIGDKLVIGDMPFMSYRKSMETALTAAEKFMKAGANAIKLEGLLGNEELIRHMVTSGIPVMGHLGFTPQSIHTLGHSYVQGREKTQATQLLQSAQKLENLGCFAVVLECIPASLGLHITQNLDIPTIGIGAGGGTSGQVLVLQDLMGANPNFSPKFLKKYMDVNRLLQDAVDLYCQEVSEGQFPGPEHCYKEAPACTS